MRMHRLTHILKWISAAVLLAALLLLAWTCIDIYADAQCQTASQAMYQADDVQKRLQSLSPLFAALLGAEVVICLILTVTPPERKRKKAKGVVAYKPTHQYSWGGMQWAMMMMALAFIVIGMLNGGLYDVLVKAINICTECIGLG